MTKEYQETIELSSFMKKYAALIIFFILILFVHFFMGFFRDDVSYHNYVITSIFDYMQFRWNTNSSRIIIDAVLVILTKYNMFIWAILDSIIFTAAVYYIIKLINKNGNNRIVYLGVLLFLIYPFVDMSGSGWMATTVNYLWTFSLGVVAFAPLINESYGENTNLITYSVSILSLIFATNHIQAALLILGFSVIYLLNSLIQGKKINAYNIFIILISLLACGLSVICPGNSLRFAAEVTARLPEFASYGLLDKMYLGLIPTINVLLENMIVLNIFYIILSTFTFKKTKDYFLKGISIFNIVFVLLLTIGKPLLTHIPLMNNVFITFATEGGIPPFDASVFLAIIISVYLLVSSCYMLYLTFDKNLFVPLMFIAGFMSRFMMGFTPTVFVSGTRTALYFYMILLMLILMMLKKLYSDKLTNGIWMDIVTVIFIILAAFNYINTFITMPLH